MIFALNCEPNNSMMMSVSVIKLMSACCLLEITLAGIIMRGGGDSPSFDKDEWESVYRIYKGDDWDSFGDYLSKERSARNGNKYDAQFRSWMIDQWNHNMIQKVRVELYKDGDEVADFEFEGTLQNLTSFYDAKNLRRTNYVDIPTNGQPFMGDDFSAEGDGDARHWTVSSRHTGDCRNDEGWLQVIDKPKPGRDRCVCGYENVDEYPTIMYAKGNRKAKWSDPRSVGHADMMQISVSQVPYPPVAARPPPVQLAPQPQPQRVYQQVQQFRPVQRVYAQPFETKK